MDQPYHPFTARVIGFIRQIPRGCVATYGQIAALAGNIRGARQVSRILHTCSKTHALPWHRVINGQGRISLPPGQGYAQQKQLLVQEGISFDARQSIDLEEFLWRPGPEEISEIFQSSPAKFYP